MGIIITGGTGFVGKNLVKRLKGRYKLKIISRKKEGESIQGNIKDYEFMKKMVHSGDIIVHLAYSKNYLDNIPILNNIIKVSKENKTKKIILLSSMSAKRQSPDEYGKNKLFLENMLKKSGLNYTILRPSIIYGRGSTSFNFMINLINKIPFITPIIGNGKYKIMPVCINDVLNAIENSINNKKTDKKEYDLPGGSEIYFIELVNLLKKELNNKKINIKIPLFFCKLVTIVCPKIISKENLTNLTKDSLANIGPAKRDLSYNPIKFKEGVKNGLI